MNLMLVKAGIIIMLIRHFKVKYNESTEIKAVLPSGKILKSSTKAPPINFLFFSEKPFICSLSTGNGDLAGLFFKWRYIIGSFDNETGCYLSRLELSNTNSDINNNRLQVIRFE